jgi:hypothetical protein
VKEGDEGKEGKELDVDNDVDKDEVRDEDEDRYGADDEEDTEMALSIGDTSRKKSAIVISSHMLILLVISE